MRPSGDGEAGAVGRPDDELKRSEQTTLEVRKRRLPVGAKGSCQAAKGWTLSMKLREHRLGW